MERSRPEPPNGSDRAAEVSLRKVSRRFTALIFCFFLIKQKENYNKHDRMETVTMILK